MAARTPNERKALLLQSDPDLYHTNTPFIDLATLHGDKPKDELERYRIAYILLYLIVNRLSWSVAT